MTDKTHSNYTAKKPNKDGLIHYTSEEHSVWKTLYNRQIDVVKKRACHEYLEGIHMLGLDAEEIPQCKDVSERLSKCTGWMVEPVEALISFDEFFNLLANKKFPAASFIRHKEELDYLKEPDIFHELFGHCPLLTSQAFADFTHEVGKLGIKIDPKDHHMLARMYWFTVEFGLINTPQGLKIYGGGILSSYQETIYALESDEPQRKPFDLLTVLRTKYRYDELQKNYFIIQSFDALYALMSKNLVNYFNEARKLGMLPSDIIPPKQLRSC